ncbi:MAG: Hsp70 family protein [Chlorobi bacterium]|nr:Hsp70 family protein [Chlorobiota bacterium]
MRIPSFFITLCYSIFSLAVITVPAYFCDLQRQATKI